jgi:ring-1,2-phenylacetyl-CoA epoxidase subunit PaaE
VREMLATWRKPVERLPRWSLFSPRPITIARPNGPSKRWGQSATALAQHHVRVVDVCRETADAVTLVVESTDSRPVRFRAGQYLTHCFVIDGALVKRAYSISAPEGTRLACTVKAIDGGVVSQFVRDHVGVGHEYTVMGPSGDFVLPEKPSAPLRFLAAGSGITPVISMIETALQHDPNRAIDLVYASRRESEIIFGDRLRRLSAGHRSFTVQHVLSQPDAVWSGQTGRLTGERAARLLHPFADTEIYLCGPSDLMAATTTALQVDGVPSGHIHRERFYAAPQHTRTLPTEPHSIEFRRSGVTITQRPAETILDAGLRHGIKLDFSCTVGGCAACKLQVISGAVTVDEPNCLSDNERAAGYILSCSAYAHDSAVLDA